MTKTIEYRVCYYDRVSRDNQEERFDKDEDAYKRAFELKKNDDLTYVDVYKVECTTTKIPEARWNYYLSVNELKNGPWEIFKSELLNLIKKHEDELNTHATRDFIKCELIDKLNQLGIKVPNFELTEKFDAIFAEPFSSSNVTWNFNPDVVELGDVRIEVKIDDEPEDS